MKAAFELEVTIVKQLMPIRPKLNNQDLISQTPTHQGHQAFVIDNRPETAAQQELIQLAKDSPRVMQHADLQDWLHNSPYTVTQHQKMHELSGTSGQQNKELALGKQSQNPASDSPIAQSQTQPMLPGNATGLPENLKTGIETLSGLAMDSVKVHYNSSKPAQLNAFAYTQGTDIHLAPGQERHLPHEAWHVVQQAQGRVKPTQQLKGIAINDEGELEKNAEEMGAKAANMESMAPSISKLNTKIPQKINLSRMETGVVQGYFYYVKQKIDSINMVEKYFDREKLGNAKTKGKEREKLLTDRWQALKEIAVSQEAHPTMLDLTAVKNYLSNYINSQKLLSSGVPKELAKNSGKATVSLTEMMESGTDSLPPNLKNIVDPLIESDRAFPNKNILETAKKATGANGGGYFNELSLANSLLASMPNAKIQIGVVNSSDLESYLNFKPEKSESEVKGRIGGDVTVWHNPIIKGLHPQACFVQAKTSNKNTLKENVIAASNQLAAKTASGDPVGKEKEREFTMTGPSYEGAIFVSMIDEPDLKTMTDISKEGINANSKYVSKVVIELSISNEYFLLTRDQPDKPKIVKENPLIQNTN